MNYKPKSHLIYFIMFLLNIAVFAQDAPIEWGEIPKADLEMKTFPQDSNASAVILCDYGESKFDNELNLVFYHHLRVKILTEKGFGWGTHSVVIVTGDKAEDIDDIEGATYSLDDKGDIVKSELDDDEIFKEKASNTRTRYRFTLPGLKSGCVVEFRYTIKTDRWNFVRDWTFQYSEPVLWSEYRLQFPSRSFGFAFAKQGYEYWEVDEENDVSQIFESPASGYLGEKIVNCKSRRWVVKNAPAIRDEPYVTTTDDYVNKVEIQLAGYSLIGTGVKKVLNEWDVLINELLENKNFGEAIDITSDVEKLAGEITQGITKPLDKMKSIYNWVSKSIVSTNTNRVFTDGDVDDILELKKGSNAEITMLLISLLKAVDIQADPVILSTRENGKIQDMYPMISQFNYVLVRVVIDSKPYYLDAVNPLRPFDLLPIRVLNVKGLIIKPGSIHWVTFISDKLNQSKSHIDITIKEDGSLSGKLEDSFSEYESLSIRSDLSNKKDIDIAKEELGTESLGIDIDSVEISGKDSLEAPLLIRAHISSSNYVQQNGEIIYLNPYLIHRLKDNPFKLKKRNFPIDYSYTRSLELIINVAIPNGYEVKESLSDKFLKVRDYVAFSRLVKVENNWMTIVNKMEIKATVIPEQFYNDLRTFYSQIVDLESEQIVLTRKAVAPVETSAPAPVQTESVKATTTKSKNGKKGK
ncbi:MAG: transglutaminase domain-containing protein [Ignavibacteria bacterium]|nr:transglutaminase domain-containing protein [Ignavibacteria bacterium]